MMTNIPKNQCKFPPGTIVSGKWHKNQYQLMKELGAGANGVVYLAENPTRKVALKMSYDSYSITSEVNVLKAFSKVQGYVLGPFLYEMDDWIHNGRIVHFYVMEYIEGPDLLTFVNQRGMSWASIMVLQLLDILNDLHHQGWIFGDLKPENLIVAGPAPHIRCIDVGGTTKNGRAVKEFTEFYDRGYWALGSRKADVKYDLFSTAMLLIHLYYPKKFSKKEGGTKQLFQMIQQHPELSLYENVLKRALLGKFSTALEMKNDLLEVLSNQPKASRSTTKPNLSRSTSKKRRGGFVETLTIIIVTLSLYVFYIYSHMF